ncbi:MAG: shikimate kinase [Acidimicrobiia bacterium]
MTLWLVGMMGSGKTSAGQLAAAALGVAFFDTDDEVVSAAGRSVTEIWAELGEASFRELESAAIRRLAGDDAVVATGGGAVLDSRNRDLMRATGPVFWLRSPPQVLAGRLEGSSGRPLLDGAADREADLARVLAERSAFYSEAAEFEIDTSRLTADEVALRIEELWRS